MPYRRSEKAIPLALAFGAYLLAILQNPGWATSDTKIDLHVDPGRFLGDVASVWSPTVGLGHIQGGQYGGYLWPMGPFFALFHAIGLSPWLVQRLWLGTILALGAWGVVRLLDVLRGRPRGTAHVVAAVLFVANPYVVVFANRASFTLLAYAALPWLLVCVHRGLREPKRWWWAAAFALILTSTGPGVNAAVWAWLLPGPVLLLIYERFVNGVPIRAFALRLAAASAVASVWWVVPLVVQSAYGVNFLQYTEQVGSIWGPTSLPEVMRLMGYWPSYLGVGYGDKLAPYFGSSPTMLFDLPTVVATLVIPGLALAGFAWTRRWRYGPFFVALVLLGVVAMSVGFPPGTPLRRAAVFAYDNVQALQFLRTTNKAGPLVALGVACLGGVAAAELLRRLARRRALVAAAAALGALLVVLAALPLFKGDAVGLTWKKIPSAWTAVAHDLDRGLPANTRAAVLPGQEFAFYRWGGTVDPILPSLTERPVAIRNEPPYDDVHAIDAFWTVDGMIQQRRFVPGGLNPMLDLLNVGSVVTATDDDPNRSGGMPPADAARELAAQGYGSATRSYGPQSTFSSGPESVAPPVRLPQVRRYDRPAPPGIVRVEPASTATVVDGSAPGLADMAALGTLPRGSAIRYAGDVSAADIKAAAASGDPIVITDSNRRRAFVASRARQTFGWTVAASEKLPPDAATLDPFARGSDAQTVAVYRGARSVTAPYTPQQAMFPEHRPYAAFDGNPSTSWLADPLLEDARHWVEVGLLRPRDIPYVDVLPDSSNPLYAVTRVDVDGKRFAVHPGWNRLPVRLKGVSAVRVTIVGHRSEGPNAGGAGGFDEIRVPGLRVHEMLRPPVLAERALAGASLQGTPLSYVFERTTGDDPFQRSPVPPPPPGSGNSTEAEAALVRRAQDAETGIDRLIAPPRAGAWRADGWATVAPAAPDPALDRLAGARTGGVAYSSSARFDGTPGYRASSAFDGDPRTAWIAPWYGRTAWIAWRTPSPRTITRLTLAPAPRAALPSLVRVSAGGQTTAPLPVRDGAVELPRRLRGRSFRVEITRAPSAAADVGIAELSGPDVPHAQIPRSGSIDGRCGMLAGTVGGKALELQPQGTVAALDAGQPLRARGCGAPPRLPAGATEVHVPSGRLFRPLVLGLDSPAPHGATAASPETGGGGRVIDSGTSGRGSHEGAKVDVNGRSWLVLGESYNRGWQAKCNGRSLGAPQVVDGFANGWIVNRGCHDVSFAFGPQRLVTGGYIVGGVLCLALVLLLIVARRARAADTPQPLVTDDHVWRLPVRHAVAAGVLAAAVFGFAFALRAGVLIGPAVALILWRGVSTRVLTLAAGVLLAIVVPLLYVLFPGDDRGGYDTRYAIEHLGAHWVAVAAFALLVLALAQTLAAARRRPGVRA